MGDQNDLSDLIQRLRKLDVVGYEPLTGAIGNKAADEIERQREELAAIKQSAQVPVAKVMYVDGLKENNLLDCDLPVGTLLYTASPAQAPVTNLRGFSVWLCREDWGHVIDGLILERERSLQRKSANPESNSNYIAGRCAEIIKALNQAATIKTDAVQPSQEPKCAGGHEACDCRGYCKNTAPQPTPDVDAALKVARDALGQINHSMTQALTTGNDRVREIMLSQTTSFEALAAIEVVIKEKAECAGGHHTCNCRGYCKNIEK